MQKTAKTSLQEILEPIEKYLKRVDLEIKANMITGIPSMDESTSYLFHHGGKKIRASLAILASGLKNSIPDDIIDTAAAIETVHAAALIHDDIIDQSLLRRGDLTIPQKKGNKIAVLIGDYMYTKALHMATNEDELYFYRELVSAACDMIIGELYQMEFSGIESINKDHYMKIIEYKTARFMGICPKVGGFKAGMSDEECDILYNFGFKLGLAFQIIDDTLDYFNNGGLTGKQEGNDFLEGKITLPYLHLMEISGSDDKKRLSDYAKRPNIKYWKKIQQEVIQSGSIDYCVGIADDYSSKAIDYLGHFPASDCRKTLAELTKFLVKRAY